MSKVEELEKRVEWLELQMDLVHRTFDKIDRKTEPFDKDINVRSKTEPQRGCDADCYEDCTECAKESELWKAEQTEPQTYITEDRDTQILDAWQVHNRSTTSVEDEPQRDDKKCAYAYDKYSEEWYPIYAKRKEDEPQTDCGDFADRLAYERGVKHAWEVAQKVFDSTVTFYEAEDVAKQITKPQTDCSWQKGE